MRIFTLFFVFIFALLVGCASEYENMMDQTTNADQFYGIGDSVYVNELAYVVNDVEIQEDEEQEQKYVIATIEARNIGKQPATVTSEYFVLFDSEGRMYESDPFESMAVSGDEYFSIADPINPGLKKQAKVFFVVPIDAVDFTLAIRDNMFDFGGAQYQFVYLGN